MGRTTNEIKKRIEIKEERLNRELTKKERNQIIKSVKRKVARENLIRGAFLALGIGIGAGGHALLTAGEVEEPQPIETEVNTEKNTENDFRDGLKVDVNTEINKEGPQQEKHKEILYEILEEYNNEYNIELTEDDISYIKSNPQFLGIDKNGEYIQDYKQNTPVEKYVRNSIDDVYILINENDNTIIASLGEVENKIVNIDTKIVMNKDRKEYIESKQKIDLTKNKNEDEIEQIYDSLEQLYQEQENQKDLDEGR